MQIAGAEILELAIILLLIFEYRYKYKLNRETMDFLDFFMQNAPSLAKLNER